MVDPIIYRVFSKPLEDPWRHRTVWDTPAFEATSLLLRVAEAVRGRIGSALADFDLTLEEWLLLEVLWREDRRAHGELVTRQGKDGATITRLVARLKGKGLVLYGHDESDARRRWVSLSESGLALGLRVRIELAPTLAWLSGGLGPDRDAALEFLRSIQVNIWDE